MTEKLQKLTKSLAEEKAAAEKLQKSNSGQISQQTSDNRKMALEISKLKVLFCSLFYHWSQCVILFIVSVGSFSNK